MKERCDLSLLCVFQVVHTYEGHTGDVELLLPFGHHLVSVSASGELRVWDIDSEGELVLLICPLCFSG